ncbi:MAG: preprotein translocase subunit SecE [Tissierellia bacterium]|nr:preprotein translocase subunit SecE [Tissierellia bacterium]
MSARTTTKSKGKLRTYFKGVRSELKKVIWPSRKTLTNHTGIVILISLIISLLVWALDLIITRILAFII